MSHPNLNHRQPHTPHVGRNGVCPEVVLGLAFDAFGSHVGLAPDVGFGEGFFELAGYAKVAEFDLAFEVC